MLAMARTSKEDGRTADAALLADLLVRASAGETSAWRRLLGLYSRRVYALAMSRIRDPEAAEEITQSVFVTVSTALGKGRYTEQGRFESWLFRVAANRVRDEVRRRARRAGTQSDDALRCVPSPDSSAQPDVDAGIEQLRRAMDTLSPADREVIELRHHAGLAFKQIAGALRQPVGTVLARHHRALEKLRTAMESEGRNEGTT
jgi:RNA polymerase sigma-70 factor (ECF subfamily)